MKDQTIVTARVLSVHRKHITCVLTGRGRGISKRSRWYAVIVWPSGATAHVALGSEDARELRRLGAPITRK